MVCTGRNKGTMEAYVWWRVPSLPNCTCVDMIYICTHMGIQAGGMESVLAAMNCHPSHPAIQEQVRLSTCSCVSASVSASVPVPVSVSVSVSAHFILPLTKRCVCERERERVCVYG